MISQVCIYTINKGEMDNLSSTSKRTSRRCTKRFGIPIIGTWVNRPQDEFIWVRTYGDKTEMEAKTKEFAILKKCIELSASLYEILSI